VEDRSKIEFWHDFWCVYHPLKASFLELLSIARCKEASVADHMQFFINNIQWNISFTKPVHDLKVDLFFNLLYSLRLRQGGKDKLAPRFLRRAFGEMRLLQG
jgi:hypothetical protein